MVTGSYDKTTKLWDAASGACRATLSGHSNRVRAAAFSLDGTTVVTGNEDRTAKMWNAASGTCRVVLSGHSGSVFAAAFSPDGTLACVSQPLMMDSWALHVHAIGNEVTNAAAAVAAAS